MKCGVKFCGGCNPRYDRGSEYDAIKEIYQGKIDFAYAEEGVPYDVLLVIGGCTNCCASYDQYVTRHGVIKVWDLDHMERTKKILSDLSNI